MLDTKATNSRDTVGTTPPSGTGLDDATSMPLLGSMAMGFMNISPAHQSGTMGDLPFVVPMAGADAQVRNAKSKGQLEPQEGSGLYSQGTETHLAMGSQGDDLVGELAQAMGHYFGPYYDLPPKPQRIPRVRPANPPMITAVL